ncbi:hypothetical protein [Nocardioides sp.]|uniref:hypothetical protein n=1 Tax=Nocardioides sp. TaxID=35761 RepID=UPI003D0CF494
MTRVRPTAEEVAAHLPGDDLIHRPDVVMDRAFTLPAPPESVWPWLVQLGKRRAGWYLPRAVERFVPVSRRALRRLDDAWLHLRAGDVIPDWGGARATFTVTAIEPSSYLLHTSQRGRTFVTWCLFLTPVAGDRSRLHLRLRLAPVRHRRLAATLGGLIDLMTVQGLAGGLDERLRTRG